MQDFESQTTGVSTLREVLSSKANSSSLWPVARGQIWSMEATSLQLNHFHFSSVVFFICLFEIYHQCLKRNLKIWKYSSSPINSNVKSAFDCSGERFGIINSENFAHFNFKAVKCQETLWKKKLRQNHPQGLHARLFHSDYSAAKLAALSRDPENLKKLSLNAYLQIFATKMPHL